VKKGVRYDEKKQWRREGKKTGERERWDADLKGAPNVVLAEPPTR
jgi:hypothetical protein